MQTSELIDQTCNILQNSVGVTVIQITGTVDIAVQLALILDVRGAVTGNKG